MTNKTYLPKTEDIKREWHLIDAKGKVLGRLATVVADLLRGKKKTCYTNYVDCGDFIVLTNAAKVVLTGNKIDQKIAFRHSGYPGGARYMPYKKLMQDSPDKMVKKAIKGMLPHNKLADKQIKRLKIYKGEKHPHGCQFIKAEKIEKVEELA